MLTGIEPTDADTMREAADVLRKMGADAALVKSGHVPGSGVVDVLATAEGTHTFTHPRIDTEATHGSGVRCRAPLRPDLSPATRSSTRSIGRRRSWSALRYHIDAGRGSGSVHHMVEPRECAVGTATGERVVSVVDRLVDADVAAVVPEVGMQVAGATPYAERRGEVAAVGGRVTRTLSGVRPNRGVRFGASSHVARLLLTVREFDPAVRFGANCRFAADVESAIDDLDWDVAEFDRTAEPAPEEEGSTMQWGAARALERAGETPMAIVDRGAVGKEPITRVVAADAGTLAERIGSLSDAL